jgi:hypothetical protein
MPDEPVPSKELDSLLRVILDPYEIGENEFPLQYVRLAVKIDRLDGDPDSFRRCSVRRHTLRYGQRV